MKLDILTTEEFEKYKHIIYPNIVPYQNIPWWLRNEGIDRFHACVAYNFPAYDSEGLYKANKGGVRPVLRLDTPHKLLQGIFHNRLPFVVIAPQIAISMSITQEMPFDVQCRPYEESTLKQYLQRIEEVNTHE